MPTTTPTPEQVAGSKARLATWLTAVGGRYVVQPPLQDDVRTILSALSTAEQDSKRLDWLEKFGGVDAGHVFCGEVGEWSGLFGWYSGSWWTHDADGEQTEYVEADMSLREAIDDATSKGRGI